MYKVITYFSEDIKKKYKSIDEVAQDFQFLEKPTKEGFYRDIFDGDLIEIESFDGKYVVTLHTLMHEVNFNNLEEIYQNFQLQELPNGEGFYRELDNNLIEIVKEEVQEA
ncbi:MAG TPA: hypothetical protein GXX25_15895 [Desulfotomaculum sp.]|nr:hypothetical protein [Desulfotomaculum sp.]